MSTKKNRYRALAASRLQPLTIVTYININKTELSSSIVVGFYNRFRHFYYGNDYDDDDVDDDGDCMFASERVRECVCVYVCAREYTRSTGLSFM